MKLTLLSLFFVLFAAANIQAATNTPSVANTIRNGLGNTQSKLESDKIVRIAYLGGSITLQEGWRVLTQNWLKEQHPEAEIVEILAAIGGTNSELGVFRVAIDVLQHEPDLVFVEFAVNDANTPPTRLAETMEGIVRKIWQHNPATDICFVYTISEKQIPQTDGGKTFTNSSSVMERLADHYQIPTINMAYEVPRLAAEGTLLLRAPTPTTDKERKALEGKILFAADGVHPHPETGHPVYFEQIRNALPEMLKAGSAAPHTLPEPLEANNFEDAQMIAITQIQRHGAWQKLNDKTDTPPKRLKSRADQIWVSSEPGSNVSLKFKGAYIGIYGARGPDSGAFDVTLDGTTKQHQAFDKYCSYHRLSSTTLAAGLSDTPHEVTIAISDREIDKAAILRENNNEQHFDRRPEAYAENNLYLAAIMIRGQLIKTEAP